jgi:uncharacterized protein (DUF4415 family)
MKNIPILKEFVEGRGYSREDWDAIDFPEMTDAELAEMRPLKEILPWLHEKIQLSKEEKRKQGERGKQVAPPKKLISLRIDSATIEAFRATGKGWQSRMNEALKQALPT